MLKAFRELSGSFYAHNNADVYTWPKAYKVPLDKHSNREFKASGPRECHGGAVGPVLWLRAARSFTRKVKRAILMAVVSLLLEDC